MNYKTTRLNGYPLKFHPIFKERLWGGQKLKTVLKKEITGDTIGESWELSAVEDNVSIVSNGPWKGQSLQALIEMYGEDLLGAHVYRTFGNSFPILIKFIDAKKDLSIQLHPNDDLARERHDSFGKTEMWHVMQADEEAELIIGFNKDVTQEEYREHLDNNTLSNILNYEQVTKGDTFFINVGKVHAIGAGVLLAEIQQTSDITYRIYDWNRKDKDGNTRELHTELALDAIDYKKKDDFRVSYPKAVNSPNEMVTCPYFITNYLVVEGVLHLDHSDKDSFVIYMCVEGSCKILANDVEEVLDTGETLLIPATLKNIEIQGDHAQLLEVHL
ncbi:type I phosphomannose isomerase catalytic subunit [Sungkyunkwania multivorans]|uniref:Phosphohexomutase n=1 Tax=Sungkyunkwania multivorans TaxID=1173618 RepID=A0ABW3CVT0_9FLAO